MGNNVKLYGGVPGIHGLQHGGMRGGWVYIMTNRPNGTLYLGVTGNIARRAWEHREGMMEGLHPVSLSVHGCPERVRA